MNMANSRFRSLPMLAVLLFTLAPLAFAEDPAELAPADTSAVSNEGVPPAAAPAADTGGSLDADPAAQEAPKPKKKKAKKKKEKKSKKKSKKKPAKKHGKKKHKKMAD